MNFSTPVELPSDLPRFTQADELLLMGSCFATNIGALLADARFRPDVNPFGVLYNPLSVSTALRELVTGRLYKEEDLFFFRECWHSSMHHGDFSSPSAEEVLQRINIRLQTAHERIPHLNCLMLTLQRGCTNRNPRDMWLLIVINNRSLSLPVAGSACRRLYRIIPLSSPV